MSIHISERIDDNTHAGKTWFEIVQSWRPLFQYEKG